MKIETAVKKLFEFHQKALLMNVHRRTIWNPVAWALYQTWKLADKEGKEVKNDKGRSDHLPER